LILREVAYNDYKYKYKNGISKNKIG